MKRIVCFIIFLVLVPFNSFAFTNYDLFYWTRVQFFGGELDLEAESYHIENCDVFECPEVVIMEEAEWRDFLVERYKPYVHRWIEQLGLVGARKWYRITVENTLGLFVHAMPDKVFVEDHEDQGIEESIIVHEMVHYIQYHCSKAYAYDLDCGNNAVCHYDFNMILESEADVIERLFLRTFYGITK